MLWWRSCKLSCDPFLQVQILVRTKHSCIILEPDSQISRRCLCMDNIFNLKWQYVELPKYFAKCSRPLSHQIFSDTSVGLRGSRLSHFEIDENCLNPSKDIINTWMTEDWLMGKFNDCNGEWKWWTFPFNKRALYADLADKSIRWWYS